MVLGDLIFRSLGGSGLAFWFAGDERMEQGKSFSYNVSGGNTLNPKPYRDYYTDPFLYSLLTSCKSRPPFKSSYVVQLCRVVQGLWLRFLGEGITTYCLNSNYMGGSG